MSKIYKWRIYCDDDQRWEYIWSETAPTTCPTNVAHQVVSNSVSDLEDIIAETILAANSPHLIRSSALICDTVGGNILVNLPDISRSINTRYVIVKKSTENTLTISAKPSELIEDAQTLDLNEAVQLENNGEKWVIIVLNDEPTLVQPSFTVPSSSKGDILIDNGEELTKLSIGSNKQFLVADSSTAVGAKWVNTDYFSAYGEAGNILINKTWTSIWWDTEIRKDTVFTHSELDTTGTITITQGGWYELFVNIGLEHYQGEDKAACELRVIKNSNIIRGTRSFTSNRQAGYGYTESTINTIINVSANDVIKVQCRVIDGEGKIRTSAEACRILMKSIY